MLVSDLRTALILLNYARHRAAQRVFGLPPIDDNLLSLVVALMLANTVTEPSGCSARSEG